MIHVPMWVKNKYNVVSRSIPKLRQALDREPTSEEIAAQVAVDTDSKVWWVNAANRVVAGSRDRALEKEITPRGSACLTGGGICESMAWCRHGWSSS